jgi:Cu/Ag efflux pump CusA
MVTEHRFDRFDIPTVEDQITCPLTTNLQGLAGVRVVRSQSAFGFSGR